MVLAFFNNKRAMMVMLASIKGALGDVWWSLSVEMRAGALGEKSAE